VSQVLGDFGRSPSSTRHVSWAVGCCFGKLSVVLALTSVSLPAETLARPPPISYGGAKLVQRVTGRGRPVTGRCGARHHQSGMYGMSTFIIKLLGPTYNIPIPLVDVGLIPVMHGGGRSKVCSRGPALAVAAAAAVAALLLAAASANRHLRHRIMRQKRASSKIGTNQTTTSTRSYQKVS
jgi:hypothetical protein